MTWLLGTRLGRWLMGAGAAAAVVLAFMRYFIGVGRSRTEERMIRHDLQRAEEIRARARRVRRGSGGYPVERLREHDAFRSEE